MPNHFSDKPLSFVYLDPENEKLVTAALAFVKSYQGQIPKAKSEHLTQILHMLTEWRMPARAILTTLAYHLVEHGVSISQEQNGLFRDEVLQMAKSVGELDQAPIKHDAPADSRKAYRSDRLRQLFITAYTNLELALLCLATHVVRMESIKLLDYRDARLLAHDNEAVFLPLMEMLGMWQLRREFGDPSLEILELKTWNKIQQDRELARGRQRQYYEKIRGTLEHELVSAGIQGDIRLHHSPASSIYRRMRRGEALGQLARQVRIDVSVTTEAECYQVLRLIHQQWFPMPGQTVAGHYYRDSIAWPKFNGYRTLMTTVAYPIVDKPQGEIPVEFHIRTQEMERTNAYGVIAARFLSKPPIAIRNAWWENEPILEFVRTHPMGGSTEEIYVFSPVGEVYKLPQGSTPIDYAYRVHSEIGNHCKRIWVNGRFVPFNSKLQNGDLVEVETDPTFLGPVEEWLPVVKTPYAREQIKRAVGQRQAPVHKARETIERLLEKELVAYGLREIPSEEVQRFLEKTACYSNYSSMEAMYVDMVNPKRPANSRAPSPERIVSRLIATRLVGHIVRASGDAVDVPEGRIRFAQCWHDKEPCRAVPGIPIVGRIVQGGTPHEHLVVYRHDCPNAPKGDEAITLAWRGAVAPGEAVRILVKAVDSPRLLDEVLHCVYDLYDRGLYLYEVYAGVSTDLSARIEMKITGQTHELLLLLQEKLNRLRGAGRISHAAIHPLSPVEKILLASRDSLPNPYTPHPVRDARLFKGREAEMEEITISLRGDRTLLVVYGASRVGKSSLLRYMHDHILENEFVPILVEMGELTSFCESTFWHTIANKLTNEVAAHSSVIRRGNHHLYSAFKKMRISPFEGFREGLEKTKELVGKRKLVIMIDDFTVLDELWPREEAHRVTYQLKWLVENQNHVAFILCVHETLYKVASFEKVVSWPLLRVGFPLRLDHLDRVAAERLIREPLGDTVLYDPNAVEKMLNLTACHPYYLQSLLYELIMHVSGSQRRLVTLDDIENIIPKVLDAGTHYFADLLQHARDITGIVLAALAYVSGPAKHGASADEIQVALQERKFVIGQTELVRSLERLRDAGVIERREENNLVEYYIRVPLFEYWLLKNHPLSMATTRQKEGWP